MLTSESRKFRYIFFSSSCIVFLIVERQPSRATRLCLRQPEGHTLKRPASVRVIIGATSGINPAVWTQTSCNKKNKKNLMSLWASGQHRCRFLECCLNNNNFCHVWKQSHTTRCTHTATCTAHYCSLTPHFGAHFIDTHTHTHTYCLAQKNNELSSA